MKLEEVITLCKHRELKMKEILATHNHNMSQSGNGINNLRINFRCDDKTVVPECLKSRKLEEFIK